MIENTDKIKTEEETKPKVILTDHQLSAVDWVKETVGIENPVVAIRGLAGTGKTTLIPVLKKRLSNTDCVVSVGAPTHRAANVLRKKGILSATIHSLAMTAVFDEDYKNCLIYLDPENTKPSDIPDLLLPHVSDIDTLIDYAMTYDVEKALSSRGIHGNDHIIGFEPKRKEDSEVETILIADESSMIGEYLLSICEMAYHYVVLVGDPGQLPPVKDKAVLRDAIGFELSEIHRQAAESQIIQAAYAVRNGARLGANVAGEDVILLNRIPVADLLENPLIVWRNSTRVNTTKKIRAELGYGEFELVPGEPLVCRSTSVTDRAMGFYNNSLWTVVSTDHENGKILVQQDDDEPKLVKAYIIKQDDEKDWIPPDMVPFRFGYCLTAHTAQGSEWDHVYISLDDYRSLCGMAYHTNQESLPKYWAYTALTRAKNKAYLMRSLGLQ